MGYFWEGHHLGGFNRAYQADYLTDADQESPDWPVKATFPGEAETGIRLGVRAWFAEERPGNSILGSLFLF